MFEYVTQYDHVKILAIPQTPARGAKALNTRNYLT
ncbi:unnamed protein product, partial [marine sediment metagenome]